MNIRPSGYHVREIDEQGWRVPEEFTLSHRIYKLLKQGKTNEQISAKLRANINTVRVLSWKIRNPVYANEMVREAREDNKDY